MKIAFIWNHIFNYLIFNRITAGFSVECNSRSWGIHLVNLLRWQGSALVSQHYTPHIPESSFWTAYLLQTEQKSKIFLNSFDLYSLRSTKKWLENDFQKSIPQQTQSLLVNPPYRTPFKITRPEGNWNWFFPFPVPLQALRACLTLPERWSVIKLAPWSENWV